MTMKFDSHSKGHAFRPAYIGLKLAIAGSQACTMIENRIVYV